MDESEAERRRLIAQVAAETGDLLANARRERDRRQTDGEDTSLLDQVVAEVEPLAEQIRDLDAFQAIRGVVDRHGSGAYPADELATMADAGSVDIRRLLARMVTEGLAAPADDPPRAERPPAE